jgi:hypothetical protein
MSFFGGGSVIEATKYTSLQLQTSSQGIALPIVYGTVKIPANLIWAGDFVAQRHEQSVGKGGGGSTMISYTYTTGVMFGMCEGPISRFGTVWAGDSITTIADLGLTEFDGSATQVAWGYLATKHPDQALPYKNIAYLANSAFALGQSNTLPQLQFEIEGYLSGTAVTAGDADPAQVIQDFLSNTQYGAHFPSEYLDAASLFSAANSYQKYCGALGLAFSVAINANKAARDYLSEWLEATNTAAVWCGDLLKFIPFGDYPTTANGVTFTPNLDIACHLTDDDFSIDGSEEPIVVMRADPYDCYNHVRLQVRDKANQYNVAVVEAKDQASIEEIGLRTRDQVDATFFSTPTMGMMAVELVKNRGLYVRNRYKFRLSWEFVLLEPMDLVTLTQADLGLDRYPVRIVSIIENDDGRLEIEAEEFVEGAQWSVQYPAQAGNGYVGNKFSDPADTSAPVIFEPPSLLTGAAGPQVWIAAGGDPAAWGGARIWLSLDGDSYTQIGTVESGCRVGKLTSQLPAYTGANPDTTHTLAVDISTTGTLSGVSHADADAYKTLCYVDGELLAYTGATLTSAGRYSLTRLNRALYGTDATAHAIDSRFARLDNTVFKIDLPTQAYPGQVIHLKFTSVNSYGFMEQDLSTVADYAYTLTCIGRQQPMTITASVSGKPAASATVVSWVAPYALTIPAGLTGTRAASGVNPTASATITLKKGSASFGTITIAPSGAVTLAASTHTTFSSGDVLTIIAPSPQDSTLADIGISIAAVKL